MKNFFYAGIMIVFFLVLTPLKAEAASASLFLSSGSNHLRVGEQISVRVILNTSGTAINAGEATMRFGASQLEVVRLIKGSVFSLWAEEPHFSNSEGTVRFAGGLPTPGFSGSSGTILTILFRAKAAGSVEVRFEEAAILADDGYGTNVLGSVSGDKYEIKPATVSPARPPVPAPAPKVEVDREPPELFEIVVEPGRVTTERRVKLTFFVKDQVSGVSHVFIELDGTQIAKVLGTQIGYELPELSLGSHEVVARVFDKSGNARAVSVTIQILRFPAPKIITAPRVIHVGDYLGASGVASPGAKVRVSMKQGTVTSLAFGFTDAEGNWSVVFPDALRQTGPAYLITQIVDGGLKELSEVSAVWIFKVISVPFFQIGPVLFTSMQFLFVLILLLIAMALILLLFGKRLRRFIAALRYETSLNLRSIRRELNKMHRDLEEHALIVKRSKAGVLDKKEEEFHHRLEGEIQELKKIIERTEHVIDEYLKQ